MREAGDSDDAGGRAVADTNAAHGVRPALRMPTVLFATPIDRGVLLYSPVGRRLLVINVAGVKRIAQWAAGEMPIGQCHTAVAAQLVLLCH